MEEVSKRPKKRQKLCHNCEAEIDFEVIVCPFCAADLREEKPELSRYSVAFTQKMVQEQTSQSLYPSSYPIKQPESPAPIATPAPEVALTEEPPAKSIFGPTVFFTLGVQLVLIGLLMLLFSHKGVVVLRWNAGWWFLYCLSGFPFLYFGYKALSKL